MTERQSHSRLNHLHQETRELLPWYVNGTLNREEVAKVEAHLTTCLACQMEFTQCREIAAAVHGERQEAWSPSAGHWQQLLARVDAAETHEASSASRWARFRARLTEYRMELQETPRPVRWTLAFQGALVLVLATALLWPTAPFFPPLYETLSSGEQPVPGDRLYLRVVFAEDITEKELRALLTELGATIVQGPSRMGVYTVALSSAAGDPNPALARLRSHSKVRLAEPVSSESQP